MIIPYKAHPTLICNGMLIISRSQNPTRCTGQGLLGCIDVPPGHNVLPDDSQRTRFTRPRAPEGLFRPLFLRFFVILSSVQLNTLRYRQCMIGTDNTLPSKTQSPTHANRKVTPVMKCRAPCSKACGCRRTLTTVTIAHPLSATMPIVQKTL